MPDSELAQPSAANPQPETSSVPEKLQKSWLVIGLVILLVVPWGIAGYFAYQNNQYKKQISQPKIAPISPSPTQDKNGIWNM